MMLNKRDKILVVLAPALLILAGYCWSASDKHRQLGNAAQDLETKRQQAPPPEVLRSVETQVAELSREVKKQHTELLSVKQRWEEAAAKCGSTELRNDRIKKLTTLLMQHQLLVLDDSEADTGKTGKLPQPVELLAQQLAQNASIKPQLRQLHLQGAYLNVHRVLQELSEGEILAIPVALSMKPSKNGAPHLEWTLLVWI